MRILCLAHRKELVEQNYWELDGIDPSICKGIYSAGLGRKDTGNRVTFASIDSLVNKPMSILAPHVIIIDEAHMLSPKDGTKYQKLIAHYKARNPKLRVVGLTATPYRMDSGNICHKDFILTDLVYSAPIGKLIDQGYLCKLRSKIQESPDVSGVRKNGRGDFVNASLAEAVDVPRVVQSAVSDAVAIINRENRQGIMFFCVSEEHCQHVAKCLEAHGIIAPVVTAKTKSRDRDRIVDDFKAKRLRAITNIDVYTTGFNAKHVDCIVMLRPTLSKGLYAQIVGRGLRIHPDKQDCLVLDYGGNIERHGPIDCLEGERVRIHKCGGCGDSFAFPLGKCPHCGTEIPKQKRERVEAEDRERKLNEEARAYAEIIGAMPSEHKVDGVQVFRHVKPGGVDSMRVEYRCGLNVFREWICLDHEGLPGRKAYEWWMERFGPPPPKLDDALGDLFGKINIESVLTSITESITTKKNGKFNEIICHNLKQRKPIP
jgi:DNA repair protein RadD